MQDRLEVVEIGQAELSLDVKGRLTFMKHIIPELGSTLIFEARSSR